MNRSRIFFAILFCCTCLLPSSTLHARNNAQAPDSTHIQNRKTVVLTFDDATASQRTFVAPLLKKMGFGATFFVCEFKGFENKEHYMSWSQIRELAQMGFEIGNHTHSHPAMSQLDRQQIEEEIRYIENKCQEYGIAHPITFAYPGYSTSPEGIEILRARGYRYARHGNDKPYIYGESDPMMVPSYAVHEKDNRTYEFVRNIIEQCPDNGAIVLCFHGVPDLAHNHVNFEYPQLLAYETYQSIGVRTLKNTKNHIPVTCLGVTCPLRWHIRHDYTQHRRQWHTIRHDICLLYANTLSRRCNC